MAITVSAFLDDVVRVGQLPVASPTSLNGGENDVYTRIGMLKVATEELRSVLAPLMVRVNENYWTWRETKTSSDDRLDLPTQAAGAALQVLFANYGNSKVRVEAQHAYEEDTALPGFYAEGNQLVLRNIEGATSFTMLYTVRPPRLEEATRAVLAVATGASAYSVTVSEGTAPAVGAKVDIRAGGASGEPIALGATVTAQSTNSFSIAITDCIRAPSTTDVWSLTGISTVIPLPEDFVPLLTYRTAARIVTLAGFKEEGISLVQQAQEMERGLITLATPRVKASARAVKNHSIFGG